MGESRGDVTAGESNVVHDRPPAGQRRPSALILAVLVAAVTLLAVTLTAPARGFSGAASGPEVSKEMKTEYPTSFKKFKFKGSSSASSEFKGKISSSKGKCVKKRKVKLFRQHSGNTNKVAGDKTNSNGKFEMKLGNTVKNGKYYSKVKQSSYKKSNGDKVVCLDRTSGTVKISS